MKNKKKNLTNEDEKNTKIGKNNTLKERYCFYFNIISLIDIIKYKVIN
jgi:hypothetical protein